MKLSELPVRVVDRASRAQQRADEAERKRFAAANRERMKRLHADPEFAAAHRERMKRLNADPEFAAANRERMKRLNADPEFAAANRAAVSAAQKRRWAKWRAERGRER